MRNLTYHPRLSSALKKLKNEREVRVLKSKIDTTPSRADSENRTSVLPLNEVNSALQSSSVSMIQPDIQTVNTILHEAGVPIILWGEHAMKEYNIPTMILVRPLFQHPPSHGFSLPPSLFI